MESEEIDEDCYSEGYICCFGNVGYLIGMTFAFSVMYIVQFTTSWEIDDDNTSSSIIIGYYGLPGMISLMLGLGSCVTVIASLFLWRLKKKYNKMTLRFAVLVMTYLLVPGLLTGIGIALLWPIDTEDHITRGVFLFLLLVFVVFLIPIITHYYRLKRKQEYSVF